MSKCFYDSITGGMVKDCARPLVAGMKSRGIVINPDDVKEWVVTGNSNQFLPIFKDGKQAYPIEVIGATPFAGSNVASEVDEWARNFTKSVVFNLPKSGSQAALTVEQMTRSQQGYIFILEGKDKGADDQGTFLIFGKDNPLLCEVSKDYTEGVSAPVITASGVEPRFENFLYQTDFETTKGIFNTLYEADFTKPIFAIKLDIVYGEHAKMIVDLAFGAIDDPTNYRAKVTKSVGEDVFVTPLTGAFPLVVNPNYAGSTFEADLFIFWVGKVGVPIDEQNVAVKTHVNKITAG